jgi:hypothetical protein
MSHFFRSAVVGLLVSLGAVADESSQLKCDIGPITKIYGASKWLVYSCDDNRSLVIVSTPDSVAAPFIFMLHPEASGYHIHGEGTGKKEATDAALKELNALTDRDFLALVAETKGHVR